MKNYDEKMRKILLEIAHHYGLLDRDHTEQEAEDVIKEAMDEAKERYERFDIVGKDAGMLYCMFLASVSVLSTDRVYELFDEFDEFSWVPKEAREEGYDEIEALNQNGREFAAELLGSGSLEGALTRCREYLYKEIKMDDIITTQASKWTVAVSELTGEDEEVVNDILIKWHDELTKIWEDEVAPELSGDIEEFKELITNDELPLHLRVAALICMLLRAVNLWAVDIDMRRLLSFDKLPDEVANKLSDESISFLDSLGKKLDDKKQE